jgi:hypothetical protein
VELMADCPFAGFQIAFVAPCPFGDRVKEGWMSRIAAVDGIFADRQRLYLNFAPHHASEPARGVREHGAGLFELCLALDVNEHRMVIAEVLEQVEVLYVHTVHLAEWMLPWIESGKIVVDIHGVVPEEETMLGRPELAARYEIVEQEVLRSARACVMVSAAMCAHFREKYPAIHPREVVVLPIVEPMEAQARREQPMETPVRVVYAGGTQAWQNVDAMLALAAATSSLAEFRFLSHDHTMIAERASTIAGVPASTRFEFVEKSHLPFAYGEADFGLVLRDASPVNRVSCPTKVFEYLEAGVIPVVRSTELGDFSELGYAYVEEREFVEGRFPDIASREWMRDANFNAAKRMRQRFREGASRLRAI